MIQKHPTATVENINTSENAASPPSDTTRVFVSGLPPKFTSEQLAAHFGSQFKVTDAHVLADRRIGFVGFKDSSSALKATEHFNKSYVRMSRIAVDLAKPVEFSRTSDTSAPISKRAHQNDAQNPNKKRKRSHEDSDGQPKVPIPAKHSRSEVEDGINQENKDESEAQQLSTTDHDWLRGRTNRTLDLVDPDDVRIQQDEDPVDALSEGLTNASNSALPLEKEGAANSEVDTPVYTKVPNARLFLRNLAFSVTQDDLQNRFKQFGKIQEVSCLLFFTLWRDMMIS